LTVGALQALTLIVVVAMLFPIIWLYLTSLKPAGQMFEHPLAIFPREIKFDNYIRIWNTVGFAQAFVNSLLIASVSAFASTLIAMCAAFSLSRFQYQGRATISFALLGMQMLPGIVIVVPLILILRQFGLTDSPIGLMISYLLIQLPVVVWMLKGYLDDIPIEIDEAAVIDGASYLQLLRHIVIPLMLPALVAAGAFAFMLAWGEYIFALALVTSTESRTLPLAMQNAFGQYQIDWGLLTAGGAIIALPPTVLFIFFQRFLVSGLISGSVKG
jgi:ABC-type glycerol-3-phosphate transport system permease component